MPDTDERTITITIDGESREVPAPDGVFLKEEVESDFVPKEVYRKELSRQAQKAREGYVKPDELVEDEEFLDRLAKDRGDFFRERLKITPPKGDDVDVEKIRGQIVEQEVEPLRGQLSEAQQEIERLRVHALDAEVADASDALGVVSDIRDLVKLWVRGRVTWDEDHGWIVTDEDGNPDYVVEGDKPVPKGVKHLLDDVKRRGEKKAWFASETRDGIDYKGHDGRTPTKAPAEMDEAEKIEFIREHGKDAWLKHLAKHRKRPAA